MNWFAWLLIIIAIIALLDLVILPAHQVWRKRKIKANEGNLPKFSIIDLKESE